MQKGQPHRHRRRTHILSAIAPGTLLGPICSQQYPPLPYLTLRLKAPDGQCDDSGVVIDDGGNDNGRDEVIDSVVDDGGNVLGRDEVIDSVEILFFINSGPTMKMTSVGR